MTTMTPRTEIPEVIDTTEMSEMGDIKESMHTPPMRGLSVGARRVLVVAMWLFAIAGWFWYQRSTGLGTMEAFQEFVDTARGAWWAVAVYLILYAIRPLVLFPATLITIAAGILFGMWFGIVVAVVGANMSAMVAYGVGRSLSGEGSEDSADTEGIAGFLSLIHI